MADPAILPVSPGWQSAVLVCGNQRPDDADKASCGSAGYRLREALKLAAREAGMRDRVLVAATSCLGVCSPWGVTVAVLSAGRRSMWVVPPGAPVDSVWAAVRAAVEKE